MSARAQRLRHAGRRGRAVDTAIRNRYRATLAAAADLAVPAPAATYARDPRHTRRTVRTILRTAPLTLIGD